MSQIPHGIPALTYCRIQPPMSTLGQGDAISDGNAVVVVEPGAPSARFEVAQVIDKNVPDQDVCELTLGQRAGAGVGLALNPIATFVNDAANSIIFLVGSKMTKRWQFLKRTMLPFVANEILTFIAQRSQSLPPNLYKAQLTLSAFEIQEEVLVDLLRPGNKGLMINTHLEEGMIVQGLHRETIVDEGTLLKTLNDASDNRGMHVLPVGGSIDTATAVYEFRLYQSEMSMQNNNNNNNMMNNGGQQECYSRLLIIDIPSVDILSTATVPGVMNNASAGNLPINLPLLASTKLTKSLATFIDITKKLSNPYNASLAPFRASKLTHYLSEYLGGNAIVMAMGILAQGEPHNSKRTLELLSTLNACISYPIGGREYSDTLRGLLSKYRAMLLNYQDEVLSSSDFQIQQDHAERDFEIKIAKLQQELSQAIVEKSTAIDDRARLLEMIELLKAKYQTILNEKLTQSEELAQLQEDNILLAKQIMEDNIKLNEAAKELEDEKTAKEMIIAQMETLKAQFQQQLKEKNEEIDEGKEREQIFQQTIAKKDQEILNLQQENAEKKQDISKQQEKIIELSAELLTLVNQKDLLLKDIDHGKQQYEDMKKQVDYFQEEKAHTDKVIQQHLEKLIARDELIQNLQQQLTASNQQQQALQSASKASLLSTEEEEKQRSKQHQEGLAEKVFDKMKYSMEDKKEKKLLKKQNELEKQILRLTNDLQLITEEKNAALKRTEDYQKKYESQLQERIYATDPKNNKASKVPTLINGGGSNEGNLEQAWKMLLQYYDTTEQYHDSSFTACQRLIHQLFTAYRTLYDHYAHTVDTIEEVRTMVQMSNTRGGNAGGGGNNKVAMEQGLKKIVSDILNEIYGFSYEKVSVSEDVISSFQEQIQAMQTNEKSQQATAALLENEKLAAIISTYQKQVQIGEEKIVQLQHENITLSVEIQQLHNTLHTSTASTATVPNATATGKGDRKESHELYQQLTNEIRELKQQLVLTQRQGLPISGDIGKPSSLMPSLSTNQLLALKGRSQTTTPAKSVAGMMMEPATIVSDLSPRVPISPHPKVAAAPPAVITPVPPPKLNNNIEELRLQLVQVETQLVQSHAKQSAVEEELLSYQKYMKDVIPQYQKKIKHLQQQVQKYQLLQQVSKASESVSPQQQRRLSNDGGEELKLPIIK